MEFSDRDLVGSRNFVFLSALLLPGLLVVGCVSLTKPLAVQKCAANSTCSDDPNSPLRDDAKDDTVDNPSPDLPFNEETPIVKPDAGPDVSPPLPDVPPDTADTGPGNKDTKIADVLIPADAADASPPPADVPVDKVPSPESGPESQGAEPPSGPEVGSDMAPDAGRDFGPDAGRDVGPDLGLDVIPDVGPDVAPDQAQDVAPDLPRDSGPGTADTQPAGNCSIFFGAGSSQGHPPGATSTDSFCVATCDDIQGWNCSNIGNRTVSVNGAVVTCGAAITKKNGYYVFRVSSGTPDYSSIYWFAPYSIYASSCPAPDGGVFP
jgi:hypothetical protein